MLKKKLPIKRVVVAGCRDYNNYDEAKRYIDFCLSNIRKENDIIIVSGCASGADAIGERYAKKTGLRLKNTLPIGNPTAEVQDPDGIGKWQRSATM